MYPVSLGLDEALKRIDKLLTNGHSAEALLTAVFTLEKTMRRSLRYMAVRRGFTSKQAEALFKNAGFNVLKEQWPIFHPNGLSLADTVGQSSWQRVPNIVTMRNKLAHGERAYKLADCDAEARHVIGVIRGFAGLLKGSIGYDGWTRLPVRKKSALPWLS